MPCIAHSKTKQNRIGPKFGKFCLRGYFRFGLGIVFIGVLWLDFHEQLTISICSDAVYLLFSCSVNVDNFHCVVTASLVGRWSEAQLEL